MIAYISWKRSISYPLEGKKHKKKPQQQGKSQRKSWSWGLIYSNISNYIKQQMTSLVLHEQTKNLIIWDTSHSRTYIAKILYDLLIQELAIHLAFTVS